MKPAPAKKPKIRIAVVESDPLRFVGFRALFDDEDDFDLIASSLGDVARHQDADIALLAAAMAPTCST